MKDGRIMDARYADVLRPAMDEVGFAKLDALANEKLFAFVADAVRLGKPESVKVCDDSDEDIAWIRRRAIEAGEEVPLETEGHTAHFDGPNDQARDTKATKYLLPEGVVLGPQLNSIERDAGLEEVRGLLDGAMAGKMMYVRFYCLGPVDSPFSLSCVQCTDSAYVAHSEDLLYRPGYEQMKRLADPDDFFRFVHSAGRLTERNTSAEVDKRRVYIDILEDMVYSVNTQYGGNTIGLKKLSLRLAIRRADREGWLAEHMFVMGVHGAGGGRRTYFTGAFPSACGKTSTAMLPGESIVGDDIAYLRAIGGDVRAVNVESGIFGIIRDVNADDDPVIHDVLTSPGEVIFSNVLVHEGKPYWLGMGQEVPDSGQNFVGEWHKGMTDAKGEPVPPSHKNARYTVAIHALENCDSKLDDPEGVAVAGIIYGGRDSDTAVPVQQSFDWVHGVVSFGASLESETTAATLGEQGIRKFDLMSNLQFLAIPVATYVKNHLEFAGKVERVPLVFGTNYWLRDEQGEFLNGKLDKHVWIKWMERRVHGELEAVEAPTGLIPLHADLVPLFREVLDKHYPESDYVEQFTIRIPENLAKLDRIEAIYRDTKDTPGEVFEQIVAQRKRLEALKAVQGDYVSPLNL